MNRAKNKTLLFRADAGPRMGAGHVMRCLGLAQAWQDAGGDVLFVCSGLPQLLADRLSAEKCAIHPLQATPTSQADAEETAALGREVAAVAIVLDGYSFKSSYRARMRSADIPVMLLNDTGESGELGVEWVLNPNVYAHEGLYPGRSSLNRLLLGSRFFPLRREFEGRACSREAVPPVAGRILVTLGGGDSGSAAKFVLAALGNVGVPHLEMAIVGGGSSAPVAVPQKAGEDGEKKIQTQGNVTDMSAMMRWADLAVSGGGGTCWELAAMGVPSVVVVLADNQSLNAGVVGVIPVGIDAGEIGRLSPGSLARHVEDLCRSSETRQQMSENGPALVDGDGGKRVVDALLQGQQEASFRTVRPAEPADAYQLWVLSNDGEVRRRSFHPESIALADHMHWFMAKLKDLGCAFWVMEEAGTVIGCVRYDKKESTAVASLAVTQAHRKQGVGAAMLKGTLMNSCLRLGVSTVRARVKPDNEASLRLFAEVGFEVLPDEWVEGQRCCVLEWHCQNLE